MNSMNFIMELSQGNPGAAQAAVQLLNPENGILALGIVRRLDACPDIKGTNFYVLYSDICNKNIVKVAELCNSEITDELLTEACSKQDRSGVALVAPYMA